MGHYFLGNPRIFNDVEIRSENHMKPLTVSTKYKVTDSVSGW
jgi:hypothetical protein